MPTVTLALVPLRRGLSVTLRESCYKCVAGKRTIESVWRLRAIAGLRAVEMSN